MRTAVLILAVLGSAFAITIGALSGSLLSMVGCAASHMGAPQAGADATAAGSSILVFAGLQSILGVAGGIQANKALARGEAGRLGGFLLLLCSVLSVGAGLFTLLTGGLLHLLAGVMALVAKPEPSTG
jgi:hypothetical protein